MSKRPAASDDFKFIALGGGSEVGRSCHILQYKGKTVMLDAGVHPAYSGIASLPFYDEFDLSTVDILLISHFHLDHAASLPYVMQHTGFKGRVFMTHPTKAIYRWLLYDFVRVSSDPEDQSGLYTDDDLATSFRRIEAIDFYSTIDVDGIQFTAYHAGHVLGAAMYLIEISGLRILFTGDYSRETDRHLHIAEVPPEKPDILICESTYGTGMHQSRIEKESRLLNLVHGTIKKGGRCLLPVFALGRAQELLLILDEYWEGHPELEPISIYYASSLARKCMAVYQTFINMMNDHVRQKFNETKTNPFNFKHITSLRSLDRFDDVGPCVILASPGMLQNGISRQLLERWAPDPRNALIITGYSVEGTMARQIMREPADIPALSNPEIRIPRRMSVDELSFAAHVDFKENTNFIDLVGAPHIILVHGETNNMGRLKSALLSKYSKLKGTAQETKVYNPWNCVEVAIPFKTRKIARTVGTLASREVDPGDDVSGLLVQHNFQLNLVSEKDLREYTGLSQLDVMDRQSIIVDAGPELVRYHLVSMFGDVVDLENGWRIMDGVNIHYERNIYSVEWKSSPLNDALADSVLAVLLGVDTSRASVKLSTKPHAHDHSPKSKIDDLCTLLKPHFGDSLEISEDKSTAKITIDGDSAIIHFNDMTVESDKATLKQRVSKVLSLSDRVLEPLSEILEPQKSDTRTGDEAGIKKQVE